MQIEKVSVNLETSFFIVYGRMPIEGNIYSGGYFKCELERYNMISTIYEFMLNVYDDNSKIGNNSFNTID